MEQKRPFPLHTMWERPGLLMSVLIHILIFSLPVSMEFRARVGGEEELFVQIETVAPPVTPPVKPLQVDPSSARKRLAPEVRPPTAIENITETPSLEQDAHKTTMPAVREVAAEERPREHEPAMQSDRSDDVRRYEEKVAPMTAGAREYPVAEPVLLRPAVAPLPERSTAPLLSVETEFGKEEAPRFLNRVLAKFPPLARRRGREGSVLLRLSIDANGVLTDVEVLEDPGYGFAEAAVTAVRESTYFPATHGTTNVPSRALLSVRFTLR